MMSYCNCYTRDSVKMLSKLRGNVSSDVFSCTRLQGKYFNTYFNLSQQIFSSGGNISARKSISAQLSQRLSSWRNTEGFQVMGTCCKQRENFPSVVKYYWFSALQQATYMQMRALELCQERYYLLSYLNVISDSISRWGLTKLLLIYTILVNDRHLRRNEQILIQSKYH